VRRGRFDRIDVTISSMRLVTRKTMDFKVADLETINSWSGQA